MHLCPGCEAAKQLSLGLAAARSDVLDRKTVCYEPILLVDSPPDSPDLVLPKVGRAPFKGEGTGTLRSLLQATSSALRRYVFSLYLQGYKIIETVRMKFSNDSPASQLYNFPKPQSQL